MKIYRLLLLLSSWAHRLTLLNFAILFTCLIGLALVGYAVYLCRKEEKGLKLAACLMLWIGALSFCAFQTHTFPALDTNNVFTGTNQFSDLITSSTPVVDVRSKGGYPAGTLDVWLNAAITSAIATGGCVDTRGLTGLTETIAAEVDLGNHAQQPVCLYLPQSGAWQVSITNGTSCGIKQFGNTSLIGTNSAGSGPFKIVPSSSSTSVDSLWCTENSPTNGGQYIRAEGFMLYNSIGATFATAGANIRYLFDGSLVSNVTVADYTNDAVRVYHNCCTTSFRSLTTNGNGTGGRGVYIFADSGGVNQGISFYDLSAGHAGSGKNNIEISGSQFATPTDSVNKSINFYNTYSEFPVSVTVNGIKIVDARSIHFDGVDVGNQGGGSGSHGIDISQTAANQVRDILVKGYQYNQANGSTGLVNQITGTSLMTSTSYFEKYSYGGSTGIQTVFAETLEDVGININNAAGTRQFTLDPSNGNLTAAGSVIALSGAFGTSPATFGTVKIPNGGTVRSLDSDGVTNDILIGSSTVAGGGNDVLKLRNIVTVSPTGSIDASAGTGFLKIKDQGSCTMSAGTCSAQNLGHTYAAAPNCFANWNSSGTLTGILKVPSTTTTVTPASSVGTDTAVVNWFCVGS